MTNNTPRSMHHIRGSVILLSLRVFGILFLIDTAYAIFLVVALYTSSDYHNFIITSLWLIHTAKFILEIYLILYFIVPWATTVYYISDHHLAKYAGIFQSDEKIYELNKIRSVNLQESWLGHLLNYGTLELVLSSSGYSETFKLVGIADAKKYERLLRQYLTEAGEVK